jgi:peptidoglycan/xylan/chitin deacetylase (PgdA/CDA1 family)
MNRTSWRSIQSALWLNSRQSPPLASETALEALAAGRPQRLVGLSFDDGFRDVADHGLPALERYGFSATIFVATGVAAQRASFPWYDHSPPVLRPDEIADLDRGSTFRFEAHTITHPNLMKIDRDEAMREIVGSREELESWLGRSVRGFCYPAGLFTAQDRELVANAGYSWATTCEPGVNAPGDDPLLLKRIPVDSRDGLIDVRAKLLGGHDRPLPGRTLYRRLRFGGPHGEAAALRETSSL